MAVKIEIQGIDELNRALAKMVPEVTREAEAGIFAGGFIIQAEAQKNAPREYGDLARSAYNRKQSRGTEVGFDAAYALYVHENMEQKLRGVPRPSGLGTYWNPGGPKFLERAVNEKSKDVLDEVARRVAGVIR